MDYFSQFGTITDITIPQPFRSFAFITFQESSKHQRPFRPRTRPDESHNIDRFQVMQFQFWIKTI